MYNDKVHKDLKLIIGTEGQVKTFKVHKLMMTSFSGFFREVCDPVTGIPSAKRAKRSHLKTTIVDPATMQHVIKFIYSCDRIGAFLISLFQQSE